MTTHVKCYIPGNLIRHSLSKGFTGSWSWSSAKNMPKFQALGMTAGVQHKTHCTKSLGTLSQSCQLKNAEKPSKIQVPSASQGTTLQAGLSKESNLRSALQLLSVQLLYLLWPSGPGLCCCWTSRKPTLLLIGSEHWGNPEAPSGLGAHVSGSLLCAVVLLLF